MKKYLLLVLLIPATSFGFITNGSDVRAVCATKNYIGKYYIDHSGRSYPEVYMMVDGKEVALNNCTLEEL